MARSAAILAAVGVSAVLAVPVPVTASFETLLACEFVGDLENLPPEGGGDLRAPRPGRSRFAGSAETLAEGAAAASGGADFPGIPIPRLGYEPGPDCTCSANGLPDPYSDGGLLEERFAARGAVPVTGPNGITPNGARVFQTHPTCPADGRAGQPALLQWTLGLGNSVVSDVHLEICLDVRKCQEADDALGQAMTLSESDFRDELGAVAPPTLRVVHHRGALRLGDSSRCACEDTSQDFLSLPGTFLIPGGPPPHVPLPDPDPNEEAPHSLQFLGRGCTVVMVNEIGQFAPQDFLTVELRIPASTRVRIRAASDSAAVCYVGTPHPGQRD